MIYVSLEDVDPFSVEAVGNYEEELEVTQSNGIKVRALLISNPHNPPGIKIDSTVSICILAVTQEIWSEPVLTTMISKGQCYPVETLLAFFRLCQKYQIHLISDEIYALSIFEGMNPNALPLTSVLSIDTEGLIDSSLLHVLYGMSKVS